MESGVSRDKVNKRGWKLFFDSPKTGQRTIESFHGSKGNLLSVKGSADLIYPQLVR